MDKVILISIPETSLKLLIEQSVNKALSMHLQLELSNKKTVFNFDEACKYIGISKSHGYKLTSKGLIPFSKQGKKNYFDKDELDQWLLSNKSKDLDQIKADTQNYLQKNGLKQ